MSTLATLTITAISKQPHILPSMVLTPAEPDNYDWSGTRAITVEPDVTDGQYGNEDQATEGRDTQLEADKEQEVCINPVDDADELDASPIAVAVTDPALDRYALQRVFVRAAWLLGVISLIIGIIVPIPMFASQYFFSRRFFEVWIGWVLVL